MAKATETLPSKSVTRRHILTGAVTSAAVAGAAVSHHAIAAPHVAAPTAEGRRLLELIAKQKNTYADISNVESGPYSTEEEASAAMVDAWDAVAALGSEIAARPARSLADIVDRAILAAWSCDPFDGQLKSDGDDCCNFQAGHILAVLSLAGISPAQCNVGL